MTSPRVIKEEAWLYSLWSGQFKAYEGNVYVTAHDEGVFKTSVKRFGCSVNQGIVYNSMVWLPEKNDELASRILIEYEENAIANLQARIDNHIHKIRILKGDIHRG